MLHHCNNVLLVFSELLGYFWYAVQKSAKNKHFPQNDMCFKKCGQKVLFQHQTVWSPVRPHLTDTEQMLTTILFYNEEVHYPTVFLTNSNTCTIISQPLELHGSQHVENCT